MSDSHPSQKTSIITVSNFSNEFMTAGGSLCYYYDIVFANGDMGSVGVMEKGSPKVSVGAELTYYKETAKKVKILKHHAALQLSGSQSTNTGTKSYKKAATQDAFLGYAWSYAKDLIIAGKTMKDMEELNAVARYIYNEIGSMLNNE